MAELNSSWGSPPNISNLNFQDILVRGIFNTGTNLMATILMNARINKDVTIYGHDSFACHHGVFKGTKVTDVYGNWKHTPPWDLRPTILPNRRALTVVMIRHPLGWLSGMQKAMYDLKCVRETKKCVLVYRAKVTRFDSIEDVWNRYMSEYLRLKFPYVMVRYEDLLIDYYAQVRRILMFLQAREHAHVNASNFRYKVKRHGHPRSFEDARLYNLNKLWTTQNCSRFNQTLLQLFHYTCP